MYGQKCNVKLVTEYEMNLFEMYNCPFIFYEHSFFHRTAMRSILVLKYGYIKYIFHDLTLFNFKDVQLSIHFKTFKSWNKTGKQILKCFQSILKLTTDQPI